MKKGVIEFSISDITVILVSSPYLQTFKILDFCRGRRLFVCLLFFPSSGYHNRTVRPRILEVKSFKQKLEVLMTFKSEKTYCTAAKRRFLLFSDTKQ
jgi:hypothetical protein